MICKILLVFHILLAVGLAIVVASDPDEMLLPGSIPILLLAGVVWGLTLQSRWVIVPSVVLTLMGTFYAAFMVVGNIAWPERVVSQIRLFYFLFMVIEITVIVLAVVSFGRKR